MKIIDAWVYDPTLDGVLKPPMLTVQVDTLPDVTIEPKNFRDGWTVGKFGPFVQYTAEHELANAGDFNVRFRSTFPVVVDILVDVDEQDAVLEQFSLPLTRARQLMRKHAPKWRLLISDKAAQHGALEWVPVQASPECRWLISRPHVNLTCKRFPAKYVNVSGVDIPFCAEHMQDHNAAQAAKRTQSSK